MDRYTSPAMAALWSDEAKYERWRQVELAVLAGRIHTSGQSGSNESGLDPGLLEQAESVDPPAPEAVSEAEQSARHDVVAFLTAWTEKMDPKAATQVHQGLTSSDVVDTATAMVLRDVSHQLDAKATRLLRALAQHARKHAKTLRLARTHGQPAGPDTWGHRVADFAFAVARTRDRLRTSSEAVAVAKVSGPVGSYTGISRAVELHVASQLGLQAPSSATQVLFRDTLAAWGSDCAAIASVCEAIATEIRLGASFEVAELQERTGPDQVGSSAIPSKRNPISSEKVTGLARVLRGSISPLFEDVALWQHRDISQSSVERVELPLISSLLDHVLDTSIDLIEGLGVDEQRMLSNLRSAGLLAAGPAVLDFLTADGLPRLDAMRAVESAAVAAVANGPQADASNASYIETIRALTGVTLPFSDPLLYATAQVTDNSDLSDVFDRLGDVAAS